MESKRIALFMLPLLTQGGGAEKYFIDLAKNISQRGHEIDVITMDENFFAFFARLLHIVVLGDFFGNINIAGREKEESIKEWLGNASWRKTSYKNLKKTLKAYDVIYSKNEIADLLLLKLKGYKNLPTVIVGVHTPLVYPEAISWLQKLHNFLYASIFYKWLINGVKYIHVSNNSAKEFVEKEFDINCCYIPYPFSISKLHESSKNYQSGIKFDQSKKNIIFLGRLSDQKGTDILINILKKISENKFLREKSSINVFGSGNKKFEAELKNFSEKNSFLRYFGHVENNFIPDILSRQDLMVAPYRWETLPYAILEAQAMGVPVVAFDIPGPSDIIEDGKTGFLAKDEDDFFEKVKNVIEEQVVFEKDAIVQNIRNKFDPEKIYVEMQKMFFKDIQ